MTIDNSRPSYAALIAALRDEFDSLALDALDIQLREHRYDINSIGVLAQAVRDARDPSVVFAVTENRAVA